MKTDSYEDVLRAAQDARALQISLEDLHWPEMKEAVDEITQTFWSEVDAHEHLDQPLNTYER